MKAVNYSNEELFEKSLQNLEDCKKRLSLLRNNIDKDIELYKDKLRQADREESDEKYEKYWKKRADLQSESKYIEMALIDLSNTISNLLKYEYSLYSED